MFEDNRDITWRNREEFKTKGRERFKAVVMTRLRTKPWTFEQYQIQKFITL